MDCTDDQNGDDEGQKQDAAATRADPIEVFSSEDEEKVAEVPVVKEDDLTIVIDVTNIFFFFVFSLQKKKRGENKIFQFSFLFFFFF